MVTSRKIRKSVWMRVLFIAISTLMFSFALYIGVLFADHRAGVIEKEKKEQVKHLSGETKEEKLERLIINTNAVYGKGGYGESKVANFKILDEREYTAGWNVVVFLPNNDINGYCVVMAMATQTVGDVKNVVIEPFPVGARKSYIGSDTLPQEIKTEILNGQYNKYEEECMHGKK